METTGEWLKATRERQSMPATDDEPDRKPWTQDYFLEQLEAATGWHLYRSNYSRYENGLSQPKPKTLRRFVGFWAARGESGPDLTPQAPSKPAPELTTVLLAFSQELTGLRKERTGLAAQVVALREELVAMRRAILALGGSLPDRTEAEAS